MFEEFNRFEEQLTVFFHPAGRGGDMDAASKAIDDPDVTVVILPPFAMSRNLLSAQL